MDATLFLAAPVGLGPAKGQGGGGLQDALCVSRPHRGRWREPRFEVTPDVRARRLRNRLRGYKMARFPNAKTKTRSFLVLFFKKEQFFLIWSE